MASKFTTVGKACLQFASNRDEGLQLEILAGGPDGEFSPGHPIPLARIIADDNDLQWFEFFTPEGNFRVPLSEIERAIAAGKEDVHGEAWYDKQQPEA